MKIKITMGRSIYAGGEGQAVQEINRVLGSKATISGNVITVEEGSDEKRVIDILNQKRIDYSRSR